MFPQIKLYIYYYLNEQYMEVGTEMEYCHVASPE